MAGSTGSYYTYSGAIYMDVVDVLPPMRGVPVSRYTKAYLRVTIMLPNSFTVTTLNETVYGLPGLQAALSQQKFNLISHPTISIQVVASLQYPYSMSTASLQGPPGIFGVLTKVDSSRCLNTTGAACFQRFNFDIQASSGIRCNLTGDYEVDFAVVCRNSLPGCNPAPSTFSFTLISPPFCTTVTIDVQITETLSSYATLDRSVAKTAFLDNIQAYFFVDVTSSVTISSLEILSVTFE